MHHKIFGDYLRAERIKKGHTTEVLAISCGISRSYITLIENGKRLPSKKFIIKIADALNIQSGEVLNWYLEDMTSKVHRDFEIYKKAHIKAKKK